VYIYATKYKFSIRIEIRHNNCKYIGRKKHYLI
jgi:hypothetical protein